MKSNFRVVGLTLLGSAIGAQLNVNDHESIVEAHKAAAANLMAYYKPNNLGTIPPVESEGRDGFQWFEMGMLWGAMMEYTSVTQDAQHFPTISEALGNAGYGSTASFIGPKVNGQWPSFGRWNDDIGWWGFAAISGSEIKGADAQMPNGVTFLKLAQTSWEQMHEGLNTFDKDPCRGGVFWHRNRNADKEHMKRLLSTVTTLQYAFLGVRIYEITGDQSLLQASKDAFAWLYKAKLIGPNGEVYDGTYAPRCWQIEKKEHSYNAGLYLATAAALFKATNDPTYLNNASQVFYRFQEVFSVDGVIIDECEPSNKCKVNQASFKGIGLRGLGYYYKVVTDSKIRSAIESMVEKSAQGMAATCDDKWACNTLWTPGSPMYSDVHTQNTAIELFNVLAIVSEEQKGQNTQPQEQARQRDEQANQQQNEQQEDVNQQQEEKEEDVNLQQEEEQQEQDQQEKQDQLEQQREITASQDEYTENYQASDDNSEETTEDNSDDNMKEMYQIEASDDESGNKPEETGEPDMDDSTNGIDDISFNYAAPAGYMEAFSLLALLLTFNI